MFAHAARQLGRPALSAASLVTHRWRPNLGAGGILMTQGYTLPVGNHPILIQTSRRERHSLPYNTVMVFAPHQKAILNRTSRREKHSMEHKIAMKPLHEQATFTIPNILTMSRIATSPAIGFFIWNGMLNQALACFLYAAVTDLLDGVIARRFKQSTDLGAILDPIADKLLITTCFIAMYNTELMPLWIIKGCITRDLALLVGGGAIRYYGFDKPPTFKQFIDFNRYPTLGFEPTLISKCNTALQCIAILVNLSTHHMVGQPWYDWSLFGLYVTISLTTATSMVQYYMRFWRGGFLSTFNRSKGWGPKLK